jgi:hypothetical protein
MECAHGEWLIETNNIILRMDELMLILFVLFIEFALHSSFHINMCIPSCHALPFLTFDMNVHHYFLIIHKPMLALHFGLLCAAMIGRPLLLRKRFFVFVQQYHYLSIVI